MEIDKAKLQQVAQAIKAKREAAGMGSCEDCGGHVKDGKCMKCGEPSGDGQAEGEAESE